MTPEQKIIRAKIGLLELAIDGPSDAIQGRAGKVDSRPDAGDHIR
jgi:hypothetical protein